MRNGGKGISVNEKFDVRKIISKMSGVSEGTITQYDSVLKSGNRKLIDEMMSGEKSIHGAYKEITSRKSIPNKIQKIKILENNGSCEICGCDILPILEFHHINMVSNGGNNNCENIKLMCPNCHSLLHIFEGIKDESAKQTLIKNLKNTQYEKFSEMYS